MDRNEKYWIKKKKQRKINFMSNSVFHTIRELHVKLSVRVLVFSVMNVIHGLKLSRTLKKQCMYRYM